MDITESLFEQIKKEYDANIAGDARISAFLKKLEEGKATSKEASLYASWLGSCAARALKNNLREEILPNGRMYYNIGEKTVKPILTDIFDRVVSVAVRVQELDNEKRGINLEPMRPKFPERRVKDLLFKFSQIFEEEILNG